jgi:hypothetical protein
VAGALNDDEVVVQRGLDAEDRVMLTPPPDHDKMKIERLPDSPANVPTKTLGGDTATGAKPVPVRPPAKKN